MKLGVLDQSPIPEGARAGQALRNSLELAQLADRLGYTRYWVAEHHGTPGLACTSPEVLIGPIAAATERIRVGSGGIMLPHYSPLKVAENFSMLCGLFPDRIDLGIGRAAGTSPTVAFALQRDRRQRLPDDFREQLGELLSYFDDSDTGEAIQRITRTLPPFASPLPFLLGSSFQSAIWAAELGLPYVFADFIHAEGGVESVEHYRRHFRKSKWFEKPHVMVASWVICAETEDEAIRLSASSRMMMTLLHRGRLIAVPSEEKAQRFLRDEGLPVDVVAPGRRMIVGDPQQVKAAVQAVAEEYGGVDEFLLVNIMFDHEARLRSYELTAQAFSLVGLNQEAGRGVLV